MRLALAIIGLATAAACSGGDSKKDQKVPDVQAHNAAQCPANIVGRYQETDLKTGQAGKKTLTVSKLENGNLTLQWEIGGDVLEVDGKTKPLKKGSASAGCKDGNINFSTADKTKTTGVIQPAEGGVLKLKGSLDGSSGELAFIKIADAPNPGPGPGPEPKPVAPTKPCGNYSGSYAFTSAPADSQATTIKSMNFTQEGESVKVEWLMVDGSSQTFNTSKEDEAVAQCSRETFITVSVPSKKDLLDENGKNVVDENGENVTEETVLAYKLLIPPNAPNSLNFVIEDEEGKLLHGPYVFTKGN